MIREEYNLPLTKEAYAHLIVKADGTVISKTRYRIPIGNDLTAELDIFDGALNGVLLVEVEFPDESAARSFIPPKWFGEDVTTTTATCQRAFGRNYMKQSNIEMRLYIAAIILTRRI